MRKLIQLLLLSFILASCSSLPTTGPINPGLDIGVVGSLGTSAQFPQPPRAGMTQVEVVAGFLEANTSAIGDYSIAREYLASFVVADWVPSAGIQVFETALNLQPASNNSVTATGLPNLTLDEQLRPKLAATTEPRTISFFLTQDNGQWRIINPPTGIILPSTVFQRNYDIANLWFVDKQQNRLVPDFIAIAKRNDPATQLIRSLGNGAGAWIESEIINLLDSKSSGGFAGIQRDGETVVVDFDATVLRLTNRQQSLLISQLAQTLKQVEQISNLQVTVGGQLLVVEGIRNPVNLNQGGWLGQQSNSPTQLFAISRKAELINIANNEFVQSWLNRVPAASSFAIDVKEQQIAVYLPTTGEVLAGIRTQTPRLIARLNNLSDLNYDSNGNLWFVNRSSRTFFGFNGSRLQAVSVPIPTTELLNHAMVGPDNVRVALITELGGSSSLAIARLQSVDTQFELREPRKVISINGEVLDLKWYSATEVVLLVRFPTQQDPVAVVVDIATASQTIIRIPIPAVSIDANGYQDLAALGRNGEIWQRSNGIWELIGSGELLAFPR
jgi:hypothetical protein